MDKEWNSLATPASVAYTEHLHLDWTVDFARKVLHGSVVLVVKFKEDASLARTLQLDTSSQLAVKSVDVAAMPSGSVASAAFFTSASGGFSAVQWTTGVAWQFGTAQAPFGRPLQIQLPQQQQQQPKVVLVRVHYETDPSCSAVQWLEPEQTVTKQHPYLFTQCQAIHARAMVPCQDSPSVKSTYSARVTVPHAPLRALMSAVEKKVSGAPPNVFYFEQAIPIPSYLLALAVGALKGIEIGPRTTVWSEEGMVQKGAWEFEETEKFIATAEQLVNPYCWGRYDLLLLPPSFPYGGMENPCLTFVTPSLLAGDRSLVDVVAHEISHSWAGNLVTNQNWQHFWLNEGWCVFIERKILGRLHGEDVRQFKSILGWKALRESVELFGASSPLTCLVPDLKGIDPDDAFSSVPYEKGYNFLYHLETVLGGASVFEPFMKAYYAQFANQSITTDHWKSFLYQYMRKHHPENEKVLDAVDWQTWLHKPGMPPVAMPFDDKLVKVCAVLAEKWDMARQLPVDQLSKHFPASEFQSLSAGQKIIFFEKLGELDKFPHTLLTALNQIYALSSIKNLEIRFRWLELCLKAEWTAVFPDVVQFVTTQGRMKFVRPLYRALFKVATGGGKELARDTFLKHRTFYHPICAQMVAKDIQAPLDQ